MYLRTMKRILALAATALLAFGAEAKNYTTVWSQDFEGETPMAELYQAAFKNTLFGTSATSYTTAVETVTAYNPEILTRTNYNSTVESKFFKSYRVRPDGSSKNSSMFVSFFMPEATKSLADYRVEFDVLFSATVSSGAKGGLAIIGTAGTLATFYIPRGGGGATSTGTLYLGDTDGTSIGTVTAYKRGGNPVDENAAPYWTHVTVEGNDEGVFLSAVHANGTVICSNYKLSEEFDAIDVLYEYASNDYGGVYLDIDNVVVGKAIDAQEFTWAGAAGDNVWETPGNWTVGGVAQTEFYPGGKDTAIISGSDLTIATAAGTTVATFNMSAGVKLSFDLSGITQVNEPVTLFHAAKNVGVTLSKDNLLLANVPDNRYAVADFDSNPKTVTLYDKTMFFWTGKGGDNLFGNAGNWAYGVEGGPAAETYPNVQSTVIFPASFADGVVVDINGHYMGNDVPSYYCDMTLNCNVTLQSVNDTTYVFTPGAVSGAGSLTLDKIQLRTTLDKSISINSGLVVNTSAGLYIRGGSRTISLNGAVTGSGVVSVQGDGNAHKKFYITGDMSGFAGTLDITTFKNCESLAISGDDTSIDLADATLNLASDKTLVLNGTYAANAFKVGSLMGSGVIRNETDNAMTLEVGSAADAESAAVLTQKDGVDAWMVKKVGTGCQTLSNAAMTNNVNLTDGELGVPAGKEFYDVALNGGKFKFAIPYDSPWTNGTACTLFTCTSGVAAGRTVDYVTLDMSAFKMVYGVTYDNSVANMLKVTLTPSTDVFVWQGPSGGYWSDAANWVVKGTAEHPLVAPGAGTAVEIGKDATIAVAVDQAFGTVNADASAKLAVMFTDDALTFTAPADFAGTVVAAGPYSLTGEGGVYTAKRVASVFTWVGGDGDWAEVANWNVNGLPTAVPPGTNDTAAFPKALTSVAVAISAGDQLVSNVVANANLILNGTSYLRANLIYGSGLIALNAAKVMCNTANLDISNDVYVATGTANELRTSVNKNGSTSRINLLGKLSGDGDIMANHGGKQGAGVAFFNDNHEFCGTFETANFNQRDATYMDSYIASSSNAVWKVNVVAKSSTTDLFPSNDDAYKYFGAYIGNSWVSNGTKMEIGHRDDVESTLYAYSHINYFGNTVRKVGSNVLNLKYGTAGDHNYAVTKIDALYLDGGTVRLDYDLVPKLVTFEKDSVLAFSADVSDLSANITNSTAAIAIDDGGTNATWTAAIAASNVGGFTKKGEGTLTLTAVPEYTGLTTVEAGKLVVPSGAEVTINAASVGLFEGGTVTQAVFTEGTMATEVVADPAEKEIRSYACPIDYSKVKIDLSAKTDWDESATYYVVTSAGIVAGTGIERDGCKLILPEEQQSNWALGTVSLSGGGKVLALVSRAGLIITIR